jgi:YD repeat-containing protein
MINHTRDLVEYGVSTDLPQWLIGKIDRITETSTAADGQTDQRVTTFAVDAATGAVAGRTVQPDDPELQLSISYTRNTEGLVTFVSEVPVSGPTRTRRVDYDPVEGAWPTAQTNALGQVVRTDYHCGLGIVAAVTDANGVAIKYQYDGFGRRRTIIPPTSMTTQEHYARPDSNRGVTVSWTDATGRSGAITSDNLRREIARSETAFDGAHARVATRIYDAVSGKPQFVSRPFGANTGAAVGDAGSTFAYDEMGRFTSATPSGTIASPRLSF